MNTYVLYHSNCYDGFGAAFACWLKLGDAATYLPVSYGNPPPPMERGRTVYIVDFSYPRTTMLELASAHPLVILDHHKTAQADLEGFEEEAQRLISPTVLGSYGLPNVIVRFDMEESGATLAWKHFHETKFDSYAEERTPLFFKYLRDRDLWRWQLQDSQEVSVALWSYDRDFELWAHLMTDMETEVGIRHLAREGKSILRYAKRLMAEQAQRMTWRILCGYRIPVVNATTLFSEVGDWLCQAHPDVLFVAYYFFRNDEKIQFGLRSRNDFDVSEIAKTFGGGGHKQAAGFVLDKNQFVSLMFS